VTLPAGRREVRRHDRRGREPPRDPHHQPGRGTVAYGCADKERQRVGSIESKQVRGIHTLGPSRDSEGLCASVQRGSKGQRGRGRDTG